jgi:spore germination cell wall hydrolase CwlJ-like protein
MPRLVEDWEWVVLTIIQEASSESLDGMTGVAEVIRERAETKYNSNGSLIDTCLRANQFSGWDTNDSNRIRAAEYELDHPAVTKAITAYRRAFFSRTTLTKGANLYHADWMVKYPSWSTNPRVTRLTQIDRHIFYKEVR